MESHTAGLVSSKETTILNGGTETEQTKNITFLQFTSRRGLHTNDHGPDWFRSRHRNDCVITSRWTRSEPQVSK